MNLDNEATGGNRGTLENGICQQVTIGSYTFYSYQYVKYAGGGGGAAASANEMPQVGLQAERARMRESHRQQIYSEQEGPEVMAAAVAAVAVELK